MKVDGPTRLGVVGSDYVRRFAMFHDGVGGEYFGLFVEFDREWDDF